jgi:WD40 repeat protein
VTTAVFNPGSGEILTAGGEGVELWSATTLGLIRRLTYRPAILYSASFSSDGRRIATASSDGTARIFDLVSGAQQHVFPVGSVVTSARFSPDPDGRLLVTSSKDGAVRVWNTKSGALEEFFTDHTDVVWNASFSPDGTRVVSASSDGTAHVYRLTPIAKLITVARARLRATVTPALERAILSQP